MTDIRRIDFEVPAELLDIPETREHSLPAPAAIPPARRFNKKPLIIAAVAIFVIGTSFGGFFLVRSSHAEAAANEIQGSTWSSQAAPQPTPKTSDNDSSAAPPTTTDASSAQANTAAPKTSAPASTTKPAVTPTPANTPDTVSPPGEPANGNVDTPTEPQGGTDADATTDKGDQTATDNTPPTN